MSAAGIRWILRLGAGLIVLGVVLVLARGAGLSWDPFGWERRREAAREAALERAASASHARRLEVEGERAQADRRLRAGARTAAAEATAVRLNHQLETVPHAPMEDLRLKRLRDHDRELCRLAPELDGCAATP